MASSFTPEAIQQIAYSVYNGVYNRRDPYVVDRKAMPFLSFLSRNEDTAPLAGADGVVVKYKTDIGLDLQGWERKDPLAFAEGHIELQAKFPWSNIHMGTELVHDDLEAMGYVVLPNQPRGKNFAKPDSESDAFRMVNYLEEYVEGMMDKHDVQLDILMHRDNSSDAKLPQGLDAYLPTAATTGYVTSGSIGGLLRASTPEVQHYCAVGATYGSGGTIAQALTIARREANLRARGRTGGGVDFILAGAGAIDRYVAYARANNLFYMTQPGDGKRKLDIGIPDTGLQFEGIPIVHDPTFEILDAQDGPSLPWTRRMYLINSKTWKLAYAANKKKYFSAPPDEGDQRVTRLSLDSKLVLIPTVTNANAIVNIAS